jgi:hypothetical protein
MPDETIPAENVKIGSQVLYVLDNSVEPGTIRPAIVVGVEKEDGLSRVDLAIFTVPEKDGFNSHTRSGVMYSADKALNSWHWPA